MATATVLGAFSQCLKVLPKDMLARLSRLFGKENGEHGETSEGQKEVGLQSWCKRSQNKWSWGGRVSPGQGVMSIMEEVGISWVFQESSLGTEAFGSLKRRSRKKRFLMVSLAESQKLTELLCWERLNFILAKKSPGGSGRLTKCPSQVRVLKHFILLRFR